jgi:hypothetical protein
MDILDGGGKERCHDQGSKEEAGQEALDHASRRRDRAQILALGATGYILTACQLNRS